MSPMPDYDKLIARLKDMRRRAIAFVWASHLAVVIALLGTAFVLFSLFMAVTVPSVTLRIVLVSLLGAGAGVLVLLAVGRSTVWAPRYAHLALTVEQQNPELQNRLIAALQLADRARANPEQYSLELVDMTIRQATAMSDAIDFAAALDRSRLKRSARWAGIGLGAALLMSILFPGLASRSWEAYSHPLTDYAPPIAYDLSVAPGTVEAVKFDDFKIVARVAGRDLPRSVTIHHRATGGDWRVLGPVAPVPSAHQARDPGASDVREFRHTIPQIKHDFEYYVTAGERTSPVYQVSAVDRPRVTGVRVEIFPPRYTGLEARVIDDNDGAISTPVGSKVKIRVESNRRLASASLVYSDGDQWPLEVRSQSAVTEITIDRNRSYHLLLLDESGRTNPHPIEYPITAIPDRDPSVEIVLPGHNVDLDDNMAVDLKIVARDDYGFSGLTLHTRWLSEGRERAVREFPIPGSAIRAERMELGHFWDLAQWGMMPEDVIHYYVEVADNDRISGPKTARSRTYTVRLPSLDEMLAEFEDERTADLSVLDKIMEGEWEMARKIEELRRELAHEREIDWDRQKDLGDLAARAKQLDQELEEVTERMQEQVQQAQAQKLQSVEMLQKMAEAQELFNEVATDEMKEAMKRLQEAMDKLDPKEVQKALSEMKLSQEEMLKRLDRTIAYLKRLQAEQKVDAFIRRLEEMLARQESINTETEQLPRESLPDLAPLEERLQKNFEAFAEELAAAESLLTANDVADPEQVGKFCESAKNSPAPAQMQETARQMSGQNQEGAQKSGGESAKSLSSLLDEMKEFQQQMSSKQRERMAQELRKALDKVLYLSEEQEDLLTQSEQLDPNSLSLRDMAAEQEALRAATERLSAQITEMSKQSTCLSGKLGSNLSQSLNKMESSAQSLSERRGGAACNSQRDALFGLNSAARQIVDGMEKNSGQCQNPGQCDNPGSQGAMGKMQKLSQQQGRLNQQMPNPGGESGGSMSMAEREALSRLKAEQESIREGVENLHSEIGDQKDLMGRLDKLAEEMKRVIEDMENSEVTEETRNRQRRIYTRMLDFQHSLQKQDFKDQRKARFGQDIRHSAPGTLDAARGLTDEEYDRLLTRYQEEGFPKEYEETIKEYFRALVEMRNK